MYYIQTYDRIPTTSMLLLYINGRFYYQHNDYTKLIDLARGRGKHLEFTITTARNELIAKGET